MSKLRLDEKLRAIREVKESKSSERSIAKKYGISSSTLRVYISNYEAMGIEGLESKKPTKYPLELRRRAVEDYKNGGGSLQRICQKYKIKSNKQLQNWIMWYNNGCKKTTRHIEAKGEIYMTKGRNTTQEEKAEIVAFCIQNGKDYGLIVEKYKVSYQQIYAWVRKYEEGGVDRLHDGRGRTKPESEMTAEEKLIAENKILIAKIEALEIENAFIKKLRDLKGGGR